LFASGLNEGFASWIEYLAVDKCYPEFDIWTQFVADTFADFLVPDALKSSHPIEVPIGKQRKSFFFRLKICFCFQKKNMNRSSS